MSFCTVYTWTTLQILSARRAPSPSPAMSTHVPENPVQTPDLLEFNKTIGGLFSGCTCSILLYGFLFFRQSSPRH